MKIGITCYPTYGGSGIVATELDLELARRGHEIHFISYSNPIRLTSLDTPNVHYHEVEVSGYPLFQYPPYSLALASRMAEVAERHDLDLFAVHYAIPHSISSPSRSTDGRRNTPPHLPFVTTLHGTDITLVGADRTYFPITKILHRAVRRRHRHLHLPARPHPRGLRHHARDRSHPQLRQLRRLRPQPGARRRHASPLRQTQTSASSSTSPTSAPSSEFRTSSKSSPASPSAMPARLMLIGDGPDRSASPSTSPCAYSVQDRVHFIGKQDNVNELLPLADLMLMPSEMESFGLAALEAMACSVPTIATRVGGVPELIQDGHNGLLFDVGDTESMSAAAISLLEQSASPRSHGQSRPQDRAGSLLLLPRHPALRGLLRPRRRPHRSHPLRHFLTSNTGATSV